MEVGLDRRTCPLFFYFSFPSNHNTTLAYLVGDVVNLILSLFLK